ncbi:MAG: hypothetical protein IMZ62_16040 [Chloroflexi bacterium]|nr:hypothetical protein [Chloroflexota bacterium]
MDAPDIVAALDAQTARRIKQYPHPSNRASEVGHPCVRFLVLSRIATHLKALHDVGLQRIFDEGNVHEAAIMRELEDAGIKVIEQQRAYEWRKFQLSGRIDAKIAVNGSFVPLEIKSCSPNIFPSIRDMAPNEMVNSKYPWVRKYPAQLLTYMLMEGSETGIMLFKNKTSGEKCQKLFILDSEMMTYAETILKKLEVVNEWVAKNDAPPAERIADCEGCGFAKTSCFVGQDYGPGFELMMDATEVEAKLERREALAPAAKEYAEIDEEVKAQFKGRSAIVGGFKIESKPFEKKEYTVKAGTGFRTSIERI